jgi:hypothetical protein
LEIAMTLPGPDAIHRWQGRMLVDRKGQAVGSIETIYLDKSTEQPEWALLEASAAGPAPTFVPLVSASEEGDTVRVPFDRTLVELAPSVPAGRELSEAQEEELYRHYGVPYSRADSPSGLPAGEPLTAGGPQPFAQPLPTSEPDLPAGEPVPASGFPPAGVGAPGVGAPPSEAPIVSDALGARGRVRITDPRVGTAAAAALAVAAGVWRREAIGRQISTAISRLGAIPGTFRRQRRRRRRTKTINQAVSGATKQTTALGWGMVRVLVGAAVLSVAGAVQGSRRTWSGVQAAQRAVEQRARRLRPSPRRKRRRGASGMAVGGAAAVSRLGAIPRTSKRRRRQRRRAKAINQAVTRATKQTTALARTMARLLAGAALLPVTSAVQGGRRTWSGVQAAQRAVEQRARRLRPSPRRKRRRGTLGAAVGGAAGYVLGARAGEQGYQEMTQTAKRFTERPELKRVSEQAVAKLDQLSGQAADKLQQTRQSIIGEASGSGNQPVAAVPDTPPEPLP